MLLSRPHSSVLHPVRAALQSGWTTVKIPGLTKQASPEPDASHANQDELPPKESARACMLAAERLQDSGHPDQAILLYEKARKNDPSLKTIAHRLGSSL